MLLTLRSRVSPQTCFSCSCPLEESIRLLLCHRDVALNWLLMTDCHVHRLIHLSGLSRSFGCGGWWLMLRPTADQGTVRDCRSLCPRGDTCGAVQFLLSPPCHYFTQCHFNWLISSIVWPFIWEAPFTSQCGLILPKFCKSFIELHFNWRVRVFLRPQHCVL